MIRVKLTDVAKEAGVHAGTASRALNPATRSGVSKRTVRRVEQAAARLGYIPNSLARGLRTSRSYVVALVIPDITNPLFPPIVRGAEQVLSSAGFTLVLTDTNNDPEVERSQIASMLARGVDGFIVATARWEDPVLTDLMESEVPTVCVNRQTGRGALPFVGPDDRRGIALCVAHLADLGHRHIVHLAGPDDTSTGRERAEAFRQAMRERKLTAPVVAGPAYTEEAGAALAERLLRGRRPFTAVVAANDLLAIGAIDRFRAAGLSCPDEVSVTGFNDIEFMSKLTPALTTVRIPLTSMGAHAAQTLLAWIQSPEQAPPTQTLLPVELMGRGTTARVRVSEPVG
ncbi:MAG: LacI family DNA-binding transcriptional regulator [Nocardioidaceae bacterium]